MSKHRPNPHHSIRLACLGTLIALFGSVSLQAASVRFAWDPNEEANLAGYRLYCGPASGAYEKVYDIGNSTETEVADLEPDRTYYFVVSAYDTVGLESPPSNEISYETAGLNSPPVANPNHIVVPLNGAVTFALAGTDPDGDPLTATVVQGPTHGSISGTLPNVTYRPATGYYGPDALSFVVSDGKSTSAPALVSIAVTQLNTAPVAHHLRLTIESGTSAPITLTGTDPENDSLAYAVTRPPTYGTLTGTAPNLIYHANAGYSGPDSIRFTVSDGEFTSAPATGIITVTASNRAPVASGLTVVVEQGSSVAMTLTGSDPDGDSLTFVDIQSPKNGKLTGTAPNVTYTPNATFHGSDQFTFAVSDGNLVSAPAQVSITVIRTAIPPTAQPDAVLVAQGGSTRTLASGADSVLANDTDTGDGNVFVTLKTPPIHGVLRLEADGTFEYRHYGGFDLADSFTYTASNDSGESPAATVYIRVLQVAHIQASGTGTEIEFSVSKGLAYVVECQDATPRTMAAWTELTRFTAETDGYASVTDPIAALVPARLYRVRCVGVHGEISTETWGFQRLSFDASGEPLVSSFAGSVVRRALVTGVGSTWIRLEGPAWTDKQLNPVLGLPSHIATVVSAGNPDAVGRSWTVRIHDASMIALDHGGQNIASLVKGGDVVEIHRLPTVAELFGAPGTPGCLLKQNQTVTIHPMGTQTGWTLRYSVARNGVGGYYMSTLAGMAGPFDGSTLFLLPGQPFSPPAAQPKDIKAIGSGRAIVLP